MFYHACPHRVEHNVAAKLQQIAVTLHKNGLVPSLENMTYPVVATVKTLGVNPVYVPHPLGKFAFNCFYQQVVVVVHKAIGVTEPVEPFDHLLEDGQKPLPVMCVFPNR